MTQENQAVATATEPKGMLENVLKTIDSLKSVGTLKVPENYSVENSIRSAWLILQDMTVKQSNGSYAPALTHCTQVSIANSMMQMVLQGLNPAKHQCAFIVYGNKLTMQREYAGSIAIAKRNGMKSVTAQVVYEGDEFEFLVDTETALKKVTKHVQTLTSMSSGKINGAYAMVELQDGRKSVEVMTMGQIQSAWNMGATKGQSPAHKSFPDQMCMKTVINRAVKLLINSSDDSYLLDEEENEVVDTKAVIVQNEINENANKTEIGFDNEMPTPGLQPQQQTNIVNENAQASMTGPGF